MAKTIKKNKDIIFIGGIGLVLAIAAIVTLSGTVITPNTASAATTVQDSVAVTATVSEWLTFALSGSGTLTPDLVDGSGNTAIASSSAINLNLGTNSNDGWSISVTSSAGQLDGSVSGSIDSPAAASNCTTTAGTDCYGINATSVEAAVNIIALYDYYGTHKMGSVDTSSQTFATSSSAFANATNVVDFKIEASCDAAQTEGSYTDTIYFTATASIP